ncbi:hypothetical protein Salat_1748300 [Sesamum alatum]|uniref:Uncharacterized protein n=1 Tax=Sesamum alatum TaxID=300844 RepID=A0AAE1Y8C9_9LAMI|nr:hypothetical protein Salat_1748300 [Sesamum alatum]
MAELQAIKDAWKSMFGEEFDASQCAASPETSTPIGVLKPTAAHVPTPFWPPSEMRRARRVLAPPSSLDSVASFGVWPPATRISSVPPQLGDPSDASHSRVQPCSRL